MSPLVTGPLGEFQLFCHLAIAWALVQGRNGVERMTIFTGTSGKDRANAQSGTLTGFIGTLAELQDAEGDILYGGGGNDGVLSGMGNDDVFGGAGNDTLDGGDGQDRIYGGSGDDSLTTAGNSVPDQLFGGLGSDLLTGNDFSDIFEGGAGVDTIYGGAGADVFRVLDFQAIDELFGGGTLIDGVDTLELSFIKSVGAIVNLEAGVWHLSGGPTQTILSVEWISGTQRDDILTGTDGQETLVGQGGHDALYGRGDIDNLSGVGGNDMILGEAGSDILYGGTGADMLFGGYDDDLLDGDSGADKLSGGDGDDILMAGSGNDGLFGGAHHDSLYGDHGNDSITGGAGHDTVDGGYGNDVLTGGAGADDFLFTSTPSARQNVDRITDFEVGFDRIGFVGANGSLVFAALGTTLDAGELVNGPNAMDDDDRLIYDGTKGVLYYDPDGSGGLGKVAVAVLAAGPSSLFLTDFFLF